MASPLPSAWPRPNPANTGWQHDLAVSYEKVGDARQAQGNQGEALTSYRESLAVAERLAKADPANTDLAARPRGIP
jgi:hypothetical protein